MWIKQTEMWLDTDFIEFLRQVAPVLSKSRPILIEWPTGHGHSFCLTKTAQATLPFPWPTICRIINSVPVVRETVSFRLLTGQQIYYGWPPEERQRLHFCMGYYPPWEYWNQPQIRDLTFKVMEDNYVKPISGAWLADWFQYIADLVKRDIPKYVPICRGPVWRPPKPHSAGKK